MPPGISGQGRHQATVAAANILLHGFALKDADAWALLCEYNNRCEPPSDEKKLEHRFRLAKNFTNEQADGWLVGESGDYGKVDAPQKKPGFKPMPKAEFDPASLKRFSGHWAGSVDLMWLANRSIVDPAFVSTEEFLGLLYAPGENVLVFNKVNREGVPYTQGEALWPSEPVPKTGPKGVWFLCQPVDGQKHPNPRTNKFSRRSEESVTSWRYMVLESDEAPVKEWLGAVVQLPLKIAAIYSSGGRSVHALIRVNAATKGQWDDIKRAMAPGLRFLITNGADPGVLSAVRLTRLPGCFREEKRQWQKLLYICPSPRAVPLVDVLPKRDVEATWLQHASHGISDADETGGKWLKDGLRFYANVSKPIKAALTTLKDLATE